MILLDTNVIAEAMKPDSDVRLRGWLDAQKAETLYMTSISIAELLTGIAAMPGGKPKDELAKALDRTLQVFSARILTFNTIAAWSYADLSVKMKNRKKSYAVTDLYIGAIASANGLTIASRSVAIFSSLDVPVICPWSTVSPVITNGTDLRL
ncbi:MAG: type II toxin-antitoxin system VapC family toxin [Erythrobacter sp.]|nr:type II toxin-antitoxin system VapC family toxin [Erythrobacter sp.]NCQ22372.1 type II toxin-antitoxin system VapC family toxin [Sphingomonadales bacterium]